MKFIYFLKFYHINKYVYFSSHLIFKWWIFTCVMNSSSKHDFSWLHHHHHHRHHHRHQHLHQNTPSSPLSNEQMINTALLLHHKSGWGDSIAQRFLSNEIPSSRCPCCSQCWFPTAIPHRSRQQRLLTTVPKEESPTNHTPSPPFLFPIPCLSPENFPAAPISASLVSWSRSISSW